MSCGIKYKIKYCVHILIIIFKKVLKCIFERKMYLYISILNSHIIFLGGTTWHFTPWTYLTSVKSIDLKYFVLKYFPPKLFPKLLNPKLYIFFWIQILVSHWTQCQPRGQNMCGLCIKLCEKLFTCTEASLVII